MLSAPRHAIYFIFSRYDGVAGMFTDVAAEALAKLPLLKSVAICGTAELTDQAATHLSTCLKLQSVSLACCEQITDAAVEQLALRTGHSRTAATAVP